MHLVKRWLALGLIAAAAGPAATHGQQPLRQDVPPSRNSPPWQMARLEANTAGSSTRQPTPPVAVAVDRGETPGFRLPIALVDQRSAAVAPGRDAAGLATELPLPRSKGAARRTEAGGTGRVAITVGSSLAVVVGLFLLLVWVQRRASGGARSVLPGDVLETLGRVRLNGRQEMHLVRVGNKLLLLAVTATGAETLTEITEPREIERLSGICRHNRPDNISASFREILSQLSGQQASGSLHYASSR